MEKEKWLCLCQKVSISTLYVTLSLCGLPFLEFCVKSCGINQTPWSRLQSKPNWDYNIQIFFACMSAAEWCVLIWKRQLQIMVCLGPITISVISCIFGKGWWHEPSWGFSAEIYGKSWEWIHEFMWDIFRDCMLHTDYVSFFTPCLCTSAPVSEEPSSAAGTRVGLV